MPLHISRENWFFDQDTSSGMCVNYVASISARRIRDNFVIFSFFVIHKGNAQNISESKEKICLILFYTCMSQVVTTVSKSHILFALNVFLPFWVCRLGEFEIILCVRIPGRVIDNEAFGFLVPSSQPEPILGCIYDTSTFRQVTGTQCCGSRSGSAFIWLSSVIRI